MGVDEFYDHEPSQFHNRWVGHSNQKREDVENNRYMLFNLAVANMRGTREKRPKLSMLNDFVLPWDTETKGDIMKQMTEDVLQFVKEDGKNNGRTLN